MTDWFDLNFRKKYIRIFVGFMCVQVFRFAFQELENVSNTSEQLQSEKEEVIKKLQKIETGYKKMEKEKNELIQVIIGC